MSMQLRNSRDMLSGNEEGWWRSRTGLEQKLVITSGFLFILCFCLVISLAVINNKKSHDKGTTTTSPTDSSTAPVTTLIPTDSSTAKTITDTETPTGAERTTDAGTTTVPVVSGTTTGNGTTPKTY